MNAAERAPACEPAEAVILALCAVLLGDRGTNPNDRGLMPHVVCGAQHIESCPHGEWLSPTSPRPHGDPCSSRCVRVHAALDMAERWLAAHEAPAQQPGLFETEAAG